MIWPEFFCQIGAKNHIVLQKWEGKPWMKIIRAILKFPAGKETEKRDERSSVTARVALTISEV